MVNVYSLDGKAKGKVDLPEVFTTQYRPDLIRRTVVAAQANVRQPYGPSKLSGLQTSADYFGSRRRSYRQSINRAMARLPRIKRGGGGLGDVRRVPQSVGGRKAHPPKRKDYSLKINRKEHALALRSAISATAVMQLVLARGHKVGDVELPFVVEDKFEELNKAADVVRVLGALGLGAELASSKKKKVLIVVNEDKGVLKAAANIAGVDAVTVNDLDVDLLAPGTHAGRLTVWGESAFKNVK